MRRRAGLTAVLTAVTVSWAAALAGCGVWPGGQPGSDPASSAGSPSTTTAQPTASDLPSDSPDRPEPRVPEVRPAGMVDPPPGSGRQRYLDQPLTWAACAELECATILVPLDHSRPDGEAITLRLNRRVATEQPRLGSILVNPGGPGQPGTELTGRFRRQGLEQYDIVGWDPRGTGGSTPVQCFQGSDVDAYNALDFSPDDSAEEQAMVVADRSFGQSCLERSGRLLQHISTVDTVHDLELLRQLLGDPALNYFGYSYGTDIGARYAQTFPATVGKMVLDAPVNITDRTSVSQAQGFDRALGRFADWCVQQRCSLGETPEAVQESITDLFDRADVQPLKTEDAERPLHQSEAVTGVVVTLYGDARSWAVLRDAVSAAGRGDGTPLRQLSDLYNGRQDDGQYASEFFAFPAIRCLDEPDTGLEGAEQRWERAEDQAPIFGKYFGPEVQCAVWPVPPVTGQPTITAPGAAPIVVIGTTGDPATPYEYSEWMAEQLESGVRVTLDGDGHGAYGDKSACINDLVVGYFVRGAVPADNTTCQG